jgi:hypothetical protein
MGQRLWRARWAAVGAAIAVALGGGGIAVAGAGSDQPAAIVTMTPVRILDTRAGGPPIAANEDRTVPVAGRHGVPADASGVLVNVTVTNGTATSFLTVYPGAGARPETSNLNWDDAQPHANLVSVGLGTDGSVAVHNDAGTADVIVDLVGYYSSGTSAPGQAGPKGDPGADGAPGASAVPSGLTAEFFGSGQTQWAPGPLPFNTTDELVGDDITHDPVNDPGTFVLQRAGVYRVSYEVEHQWGDYEGTLGLVLGGIALSPTNTTANYGMGGSGSRATRLITVPQDGPNVLQLVYAAPHGDALYAPNINGSATFASITIERVGSIPA